MKSVCSFVSVSFFASSFRSLSRRPKAGAAFTFGRLIALLALSSAPMLAAGQTAHFDGAQNSPVINPNGTQILAIAVDAAGDEFFTTQNAEVGLAFQPGRSVRYVPAAFHQNNTRLSDGGRRATAKKMNASSCTYQGVMSQLFVRPANSNTIYGVGGLNAPMGLAIDPLGDLYVLDAYTGNIFKYLGANGSVQIESVPGGVTLSGPTIISAVQGNTCVGGLMASDSQGNLYYTNLTGNTVEEIEAVNGVIPSSPTTRSLGSGFDFTAGIAVDRSGDVYVASSENNTVEELLAVNGSIPASPTIRALGSGFSMPAAVAVDTQGDVYVGDFLNDELKELVAVNGSVPSSPTIKILGSFNEIEAIALDESEDIFASYSVRNGSYITELTPSGANFGQVNVGTTSSATIPMDFTFDTGGTLGGISVLTQGAAGLDYSNAGTGTCTANAAYSVGQTCTVNVSFTPKFAGTRNGAVVLYDTNGNAIATGYLQGTGLGPQINFLPGTESTIASASNGLLFLPYGIAVDGGGSIYIADLGDNQVLKETFTSSGYAQSTIPTSALLAPEGVALDGSGNIYIADYDHGRVLKETPSIGGYTESLIADSSTGQIFPGAVAVDGSGNVYFTSGIIGSLYKETLSVGSYTQSIIPTPGASSNAFGLSGVAVDRSGNVYVVDSGNNQVLKETPSVGAYVQSTLPISGMDQAFSVTVDGSGNVYVVDLSGNQIIKETPSGGTYIQSTISTSRLDYPHAVAVDGGGNVYISDGANMRVLKENFADTPSLTFASVAVSSTSTDSPQTVTVENNGNAALNFPIPATGSNPSIGPDFTLNENAPNTCPVVTSGSSAAGTLPPGATCALAISFAPTVSGALNEALALTDNNLNAASPAYATQSISLSGTGMATPTITWSAPAAITYGTPLSATQLDATASVPGTFSYSPAAGTVLTAGTQTITVTFTPTDTTDYTTATASVTLIVNQALPTVNWAAPAAITYGAALGSTQLNASSAVAGSFSYSPLAGTVLGAGTQTLMATFTPTDTTDYSTTTATVMLTVNQATPTITWATPAAITYGTALGSTQLNASSTVAGTFSYSPAASAVPTAGTQTLTATFTPTDTADYTTGTATVILTVNRATPTITWAVPATITYGTPLGSTQLDATANVPGMFSYSPTEGTVLGLGQQTLTAVFAPADSVDYASATANVSLTVTLPFGFVSSSVNLGTENIGTASPVQTLTVTLGAPVTLGSTTVTTQGSAGLDFQNTGTGTCIANTAYNAGQTCTVNVLFTPSFAGMRYGGVVLHDAAGNVIATAYLQGTGVGPQINFLPGTERIVTSASTGATCPYAIAVDGSANIYIADCVNNVIWKETPSSGGYVQSTIPTSSLDDPVGVAVDGGGNVYIADIGNNRVLKETLSSNGYTESVVADSAHNNFEFPNAIAVDGSGNVFFFATDLVDFQEYLYEMTPSPVGYLQSTIPYSGISLPGGLAVDGNENVYIVDFGNGQVIKEAPSAGGYIQSTLPINGLFQPNGIAVDAMGSIYVVDIGGGPVLKETPVAGSYVQSTIPTSQLNEPLAVAVDQGGNVYVADAGTQEVLKEDFVDAPTLSFADTPIGSTSADSPQTVTVLNAGNAALTFMPPPPGSGPIISQGFDLNNGVSSACPVSGNGTPASESIAAGASCQLSISFAPTAIRAFGGSLLLTDNSLYPANPNYATQRIELSGTGTRITPTIIWTTPASITYGTPLSSKQLDASSTVAGRFTYTPAAGKVLGAGQQTLTVTFVPNDTAEYTAATAGVTFTVNQATPVVKWPAPAAITYGTPLSSSQLDATATVPGSFAYTPASGTVLVAGNQTLSATFTPTDTTDYNIATATVTLLVKKATPVITWPAPAAITAGTPLGSIQLDATASVAGAFVYSPTVGTVLAAGNQTLSTTFTPADSTDYNTATDSVVLSVKGFTLSASSGSLTVTPGRSGTDTITMMDVNGFNSSVTLSASGLPSGVTATFGTNPTTGKSVLTFTVSKSAAPGTYTVTVKGVSGSMSASTTISLTI